MSSTSDPGAPHALARALLRNPHQLLAYAKDNPDQRADRLRQLVALDDAPPDALLQAAQLAGDTDADTRARLLERLAAIALPTSSHGDLVPPRRYLPSQLVSLLEQVAQDGATVERLLTVLSAMAPPLEDVWRWTVTAERSLAVAAGLYLVRTTALTEQGTFFKFAKAFVRIAADGEAAAALDAVAASPAPQLAKAALALACAVAPEQSRPAHAQIIVSLGLQALRDAFSLDYSWLRTELDANDAWWGAKRFEAAIGIVARHAPSELEAFAAPGLTVPEVLRATAAALPRHAAGRLVAKAAKACAAPDAVASALALMLGERHEFPRVEALANFAVGIWLGPDGFEHPGDLYDWLPQRGPGVQAAAERFRQSEAAALAGALAAVACMVPTQGPALLKLFHRWLSEFATPEENTLRLAAAAENWRGVKEAFDAAPAEAFVPFFEDGAGAGLADELLKHPAREAALRLAVERATEVDLRGHARALLLHDGIELPPPAQTDELVAFAGELHGPLAPGERRLVELLLSPERREELLVAPKAIDALSGLVRTGCAEERSDLAGATRALWLELLHRRPEGSLGLLGLLGIPGHGDKAFAFDLGQALAGVSGKVLDEALAAHRRLLASDLALAWARSPKTPRALRVRALWQVLCAEDFDPGTLDFSGDIALVAELIELAEARWPSSRLPLERALNRALDEALLHPVRPQDVETQDAPIARLRALLRRYARSNDMVASWRVRLAWRLEHARVRGKRVPERDTLRCWIETAAWLRDGRDGHLRDALERLEGRLDADDRAALAEAFVLARSQIDGPPHADAGAVIDLVLGALVIEETRQ